MAIMRAVVDVSQDWIITSNTWFSASFARYCCNVDIERWSDRESSLDKAPTMYHNHYLQDSSEWYPTDKPTTICHPFLYPLLEVGSQMTSMLRTKEDDFGFGIACVCSITSDFEDFLQFSFSLRFVNFYGDFEFIKKKLFLLFIFCQCQYIWFSI